MCKWRTIRLWAMKIVQSVFFSKNERMKTYFIKRENSQNNSQSKGDLKKSYVTITTYPNNNSYYIYFEEQSTLLFLQIHTMCAINILFSHVTSYSK